MCLTPVLLLVVPWIDAIYQSYMTLSYTGMEFQLRMGKQLLLNTTATTILRCSALCNQLITCRTFDYDTVSRRCRLFEGDTTTGSIIVSSSSSSMVGSVRIDASLYAGSHGQPCALCQEKRYEICAVNTSSCQCPANTYWNGFVCALQLFNNQSCAQGDACRPDFNLTCAANCYGEFSRCQKAASNSEFCLHSCIRCSLPANDKNNRDSRLPFELLFI
jgi:PAN domain